MRVFEGRITGCREEDGSFFVVLLVDILNFGNLYLFNLVLQLLRCRLQSAREFFRKSVDLLDVLRKWSFFKFNGCLSLNKLVNLILNSLDRRLLRSNTLVFNFLNFFLHLIDLFLNFVLDFLLNISN